MSDQDFVHLHVHTEYSLLDGLSRIDKLVDHAKNLGMKSLAITDHGTMFGVIDFYRACKAAEIRPIIGVESYLARASMQDRDPKLDKKAFHLLLLAKNATGYQNLLQIASKAQLEGYYYRPRIDWDFLAQHSEGLIVTSGCLAAQIPNAIMAGQEDEARRLLDNYIQVFGKENFFFELQNHDIEELRTVNNWLIDSQKHFDVPLVATNDVHYVLDSDYDPHDTLLCIQTTSLKREDNRLRMSDASYHLKDQANMWRDFGHIRDGSALTNTLRIAEMCDVDLDTKGYHLPIFPVPRGFTADTYLRHLCERGLEWRYGERGRTDPALLERLDYELATVHRMGFDTYFLIVWDLCEYARHADIWWNVRGSGAGSLAAYALGITSIDPIQNNLLFERFLNPGRVSMPDIDLDYPDDQRSKMIEYTARKYGVDKVAAIITFGTMGPKAAVRDVGRALDIPLDVVNQAARLIPTEPKPKPIMEYVESNPELQAMYKNDADIRRIIDTAKELQGVSRHASTHAAGVIVADKPLVEYIPLHRLTSGDEDSALKAVTQFPMETCESIGLLKIDFLGLSTLTIMRKACELIEQYGGPKYLITNIPYRHEQVADDLEKRAMLDKAFALIARGETVGVFQVESSGMQQMLRGMRPNRFENIVAAVSLYRPGPMDYIPTYNARMHGEEKFAFLHPKLEPILGETYGICISGDSTVIDAVTGKRYRIDALQNKVGSFYVQGVDDQNKPAVGLVTCWSHNGLKSVYRLALRNGATIKATADHRFLTEDGWKTLGELQPGDYIGTPAQLLEPSEPIQAKREKLRVLAYLIADGSLSTYAAVDFVNKDDALIAEYERCLEAFENIQVVYVPQIHGVTRVSTKNRGGKGESSLLAWMRQLGLKYPPSGKLGGCRSQEKFIPDFIFQLSDEDIAFFLASLWDCDGYIDNKLCHYKTISKQLAYDVQTLLLRLGIASVIHFSSYTSVRGERQAFQVTVYETARLADFMQPYMITSKREIVCRRYSATSIKRSDFVKELDATVTMSRKALMAAHGVDTQHFYPRGKSRERISAKVVKNVATALSLDQTLSRICVNWEEIQEIELIGEENVYDLTVEGTYSFIANNIITHNCVYQEQIMQIAGQLFGYELGEADLMRKAVSKKREKDLLKHKSIFMERGPENGVDTETAAKIFADIEFFANYGFNRAHATDYAMITVQTAFLKALYPEEYMTAILTVQRDDATKLAHFLEECRRMNIPILPPDVNFSMLNFDIQHQDDGKRGIRFGLAGIKNAGVGALQPILDEREEGGEFTSLEDFCRRVDLRAVGKRTLESLIKVGAMRSFGKRQQLIDELDRIVSFSVSYHKDKEVGQMNLFGANESLGDDGIKLREIPEVEARTMLDWEKELLGLYVTGRPADKYRPYLMQSNTSEVIALKENGGVAATGKNVTLAGEIVTMRKLVTKGQEMMCVIQLEDWHDSAGMIEVVLFPRTWQKCQDLIKPKEIVKVTGKFDTARGDPQIIAEDVTQNFNVVMADTVITNGYNGNGHSYEPPAREYTDDDIPASFYDENNAPAPVYFTAAVPAPTLTVAKPIEPAPAFVAPATEGAAAVPIPMVEPQPAAFEMFELDEGDPAQALHWVNVYIQRSGDDEKDRRRLRMLFNILTEYPGNDRFSIIVEGRGQPIKMEFPNHTTNSCDSLLIRLNKLVGAENIEVFARES